MHRQGDGKGGSFPHLAFYLYIAAVILYKAVTDGKTQADALDLAFGGKKAVKNFIQVLFSDAGAGIGNFNVNDVGVAAGDHRQGAAPGHGVPGVGHHVQKYLAQLVFGGIYQAQPLCVCLCNIDVVFLELFLMQQQNFIQHGVDVHRMPFFLIRF